MIPGRAETDEQKRAVVERILLSWRQAPHLRLGQLLVIATPGCDLFYVEDDALTDAVSQAFSED